MGRSAEVTRRIQPPEGAGLLVVGAVGGGAVLLLIRSRRCQLAGVLRRRADRFGREARRVVGLPEVRPAVGAGGGALGQSLAGES
ncbi:MAG TPA: hypothetical protein VNH38_06445 [Candidatus Dormibacteraeota bacterium]|nr:hypothetical protein [Candidatus Dormibacteraeota bacterium]